MNKTIFITSIILLAFLFIPKNTFAKTFLPITSTENPDYCIITSLDISSLEDKNAKELVPLLGVSSDAVFFRALNRLVKTEKGSYILLQESKDGKVGCAVPENLSSDLKYWATFAMKDQIYSKITAVVPFQVITKPQVAFEKPAEIPKKLGLGKRIIYWIQKIGVLIGIGKKCPPGYIFDPALKKCVKTEGGREGDKVGYVKLTISSGSSGALNHALKARANQDYCTKAGGQSTNSCLFTYPAGSTVNFYPQILPLGIGAAYQGNWFQSGATGPNQCAISSGVPLNDAHYCGNVTVAGGQTHNVNLDLRLVK